MSNCNKHKNRLVPSFMTSQEYDEMQNKNEQNNDLIRVERYSYMNKCFDWASGTGNHPGELRFSFEKSYGCMV